MNIYVYTLIITLILLVLLWYKQNNEQFDIPLRSSSAWDWNLGPGYGAGYGTGYGLYGMWPSNIPNQPWQWWMWGRRPLIFRRPFTMVPQIDYNDTPDQFGGPTTNYSVTLVNVNGVVTLAVNGVPNATLQLDKGRDYFFHIYTPTGSFAFMDNGKYLSRPISEGTITMNFANNLPEKIVYTNPNVPGSGGIVYLNSMRAQ
jgi:hypothetical protein